MPEQLPLARWKQVLGLILKEHEVVDREISVDAVLEENWVLRRVDRADAIAAALDLERARTRGFVSVPEHEGTPPNLPRQIDPEEEFHIGNILESRELANR